MSGNNPFKTISGKFLHAQMKSLQTDVDKGRNNFISRASTALHRCGKAIHATDSGRAAQLTAIMK